MLLALLIHGPMLFVTFENTYDAFVHIFFAEHYANNWFDHWNYKWYTGFTTTSYPPQIHMIIALLSKLVGLKGGFIVTTLISIMLFIRGVYYFSQLWVSERSAAFASCAATISSSYLEAIHIFGQLPSISGIALLLNTLPIVYNWVRTKKKKYFFLSLGLLSLITTTHHVTTIFGMVFFIFPVLGLALIDNAYEKEKKITFYGFLMALKKDFFTLLFFGICTLFVTVLSIFPYWYWSKTDPISQIPIPHGSRDSFIEILSSGLVFFLIPWGMMLLFLPYLFSSIFKRRNIILGMSILLAFILGTGGTTPIPVKLLGETAFNILTLDRFTYWATILSLPFWGDFIYQLVQGELKKYLVAKCGQSIYKIILTTAAIVTLGSTIFIMNIGYFRPFQPKKIDITPIQSFLSTDNHDQWRYLTLGFGDQVAWLAANTSALSIDGNYHSARRLPEMTTRVVERLENAKYQGHEGLGALHQFLTIPEKYNLKYIFNNDKFYEPILFFSGWNKIQRLENNIDIWEKPDIPKLPNILPRKHISKYQQIMWSTIPISVLIILILVLLISILNKVKFKEKQDFLVASYSKNWGLHSIWALLSIILLSAFIIYQYIKLNPYATPESITTAFFDALDFKQFNKVFDYYDPTNRPSKEQILLDISLEDGIINSFGKLNTLDISIEEINANKAIAIVNAEWITSMQAYDTAHKINLVKKNKKWYLESSNREIKIPAARTVSNAQLNYTSLGKRDAISGNTNHNDILDRPDIELVQANLIQHNNAYYITGEVINTDVVPAYITVSGALLNENGAEILQYNARDRITQRLSPKERTYFKIDFTDAITQQGVSSEIDNYSNKEDIFCQFELPFNFSLNVKSLETSESNYNFFGIINPTIKNNILETDLYNYGGSGVNIPRLLVSYVNKNNDILWVQNKYLEKEIRPLRSKNLSMPLINPSELDLYKKIDFENILVNGYSPKSINNPKTSQDNFVKLDEKYKIHLSANGYVVK